MTEPTDDVRIIDLDAKRAARAEARKDHKPITIRLDGVDYELPAEMPADFADLVTGGDFKAGFRALLGAAAFETFWAAGISVDDLREFADAIAPAYGLGGDSGNSSGSGGSSPRTGRR